ncbi:MAG TPA: hypothetical protein VFE47_05725 [Tepidisphaeraceae bacterium]|jgi:hypothetical protein|nr:hypothetical protein [Tepidisphaeraceae bacterium]
MDDDHPPTLLSYAPRQRSSRRVALLTTFAILAIIAVIVAAVLHEHARRAAVAAALTMASSSPSQVPIGTGGISKSSNAIRVPYGKFFFLRDGTSLVAIKIASGSSDPINYQWLYLANGVSDFHSPTVVSGSGLARETDGNAMIVVGPISVEWSQGSIASGWIYWRGNASPQLAVSPEFVDDPTKAHLAGSRAKWYRQFDPAP